MLSISEDPGPMIVLHGIPINAGKVLARTCLYSVRRQQKITLRHLDADSEVQENLLRYEQTLADCSDELDRTSNDVAGRIGKAEAEIFVTQRHIMNDPDIVARIRLAITHDRKNLEFAIQETFSAYEVQFKKLDNEYLRERASDIDEVRRRLLDHLHNDRPGFACEGQAHCRKGEDRIIAADLLTPDMVVNLKLERVLGFVTEHGGMSSHAAIIARSLGIPAVSGLPDLMTTISCGTQVLIDGDTGTVYINPDRKTINCIVPVVPVSGEEVCVIQTPHGMSVMANASLLEDVNSAVTVKADGIGLLRTEILFLRENRLLSEDEQYEFYRQILHTMGDKPVTFRMLDVGGDKPLPFFRIKKEENPYLGWRGARFLLGSMDIFGGQMRALARLSTERTVRIMFPMVVDVRQYRLLTAAARDFMQQVTCNPDNIELGAMFEIPSACLSAGEIYKEADFGSIGSNDLTQYLFAVDRNNELVSADYDQDHPILWDTLRQLSEAARVSGKPLSICGEMAAREGMARRLLDIGITALSVSPRLVPKVRNEVAAWASEKSGPVAR